MNTRDLLVALRGGESSIPADCNICGEAFSSDDLDPISGDQWACEPCIKRILSPDQDTERG